jgi:hypothetical protein
MIKSALRPVGICNPSSDNFPKLTKHLSRLKKAGQKIATTLFKTGSRHAIRAWRKPGGRKRWG